IAASARSRRACGPSFVFRAKTRSCRASKSDRIGMGMANLLLFAALNQIAADLGIPPRVTLSGTWYYPSLGVRIRSIELGSIDAWRTRITFSLPPAMLAFLLFNAGLGVRTKELAGLLRNPSLLLVGALGNLFVPLAFVVGVNITMKLWHNSDEVQQLLTGLALVASMPIAGASTAWAQNANGNLAMSLGLILLTTLCSPVLTPIVLDTVGFVTTGDYSEDLHELAANGAGGFLAAWVILPSLLGNYSNASINLPSAADLALSSRAQ